MNVTFYKNTSDPKRVDKSILSLGNANCEVKHDRGILEPTVIVAKASCPSFAQVNYMYISGLNRYYYARVAELPAGMLQITGSVDVLMTYRSGIKNVNTTILRQENLYNKYYVDDKCPIRTTKTVVYKTLGEFPTARSIILTVDGGER